MSINGIYTEPGVFSQFKPTRTFPVIPGGLRVAALVGAGRTTNTITGEEITKGVLDATDALAHTATVLGSTITDEDFNTYNLATDYVLSGGGVSWAPNIPAALTGTTAEPFNLHGLVVAMTIGSGAEQTYTFKALPIEITAVSIDGTSVAVIDSSGIAVGDVIEQGAASSVVTFVHTPTLIEVVSTVGFTIAVANAFSAGFSPSVNTAATAAEVVAALNAGFTGITATVDTSKVKISTTLGNNTSLLVGVGTGNTALGFTPGDYAVTPREPVVGKKYSVTYDYARASADYIPTFFFNQSDIEEAYGAPSTSNTLSLGAEIVFAQGASAVCLIQVDPADGSEFNMFKKAIDKLAPVNGINIVVALSTLTSIHSYLKTHCINASSITERKERTTIVAMPAGTTVTQLGAQALALAHKRVVLSSSTACSYVIGSDIAPTTLSGAYVSAAVAGVRTSRAFDVADPATRKELVGFSDITDGLLRQEKILLLSKGVMVIENIAGVHRIMQQVTTDSSTIENREYSVVEVIDFVASTMRASLENIYIGQKILTGTASQVRSTILALLNNMISAEILTAAQNVQAEINISDPTQIDVSFEISPVFPLNYILITFSLSPNQ